MNITLFASKSLYCSKGAPQKSKPELCPYVGYDRCIWLPAFFSYFFCQPFVYSVAFWCHPSSCCEDKGIEWRLLCVNHSLIVFILLLFFMLLVDLCQGLPRIWLWGRMCDPYVKESFLTAIPQSSCRDIQPCITVLVTCITVLVTCTYCTCYLLYLLHYCTCYLHYCTCYLRYCTCYLHITVLVTCIIQPCITVLVTHTTVLVT